MIKGLHGYSFNYSNVVTQAKIAYQAGFDSVQLLPEHLFRYLEHGGTIEKYQKLLDNYGLNVGNINAIKEIGRHQGHQREQLLAEAERIFRTAQAFHCPVVQIMTMHEVDYLPEEQMLTVLADNIRALAEMGMKYGGIKLQIELVGYTKFNKIQQALEVIKRSGMDNVGLVIDFWHLYVSGHQPQDIAKLDKDQIIGVHICDGRLPHPGELWDELIQRDYAVGEGDIDVQAWVNAVKATGFDGQWSLELVSPRHWEDDLLDTAITNSRQIDDLVQGTN